MHVRPLLPGFFLRRSPPELVPVRCHSSNPVQQYDLGPLDNQVLRQPHKKGASDAACTLVHGALILPSDLSQGLPR